MEELKKTTAKKSNVALIEAYRAPKCDFFAKNRDVLADLFADSDRHGGQLYVFCRARVKYTQNY